MLIASKISMTTDVYCLERVIVGAQPILDNINYSMSKTTGNATVMCTLHSICVCVCVCVDHTSFMIAGRLSSLNLWKQFGNTIANNLVPSGLKKNFIDPINWKQHKV